jgi:hypothetical protein
MIDFGFVIYGVLLVAMVGLAVRHDARRMARKRLADAVAYSKETPT